MIHICLRTTDINSNNVSHIEFNHNIIDTLVIPTKSSSNTPIYSIGSPLPQTKVVSDKVKIRKLIIKENIREIKAYAFTGCNIEELDLSEATSLESIEKHAFENNQIETLVLPPNLTSIGKAAFNLNRINNVVFNKRLKALGEACFQYNLLTEIDLSETNIKEIPTSAFSSNAIEHVLLPKYLITIGTCSFSSNYIETIELSDFLQEIGLLAFYNNELTRIEIPDSVTHIGRDAFGMNQKLEEIFMTKIPLNQHFEKNWQGAAKLTLLDEKVM